MIKKSKIYCFKKRNIKIGNFRQIIFVFREIEWYRQSAIGIWWKYSTGIGIIGKPGKVIKYKMIGLNLGKHTTWIEFKWIGKTKNGSTPEIQMKDEGEELNDGISLSYSTELDYNENNTNTSHS
jgi:hypothetical protein